MLFNLYHRIVIQLIILALLLTSPVMAAEKLPAIGNLADLSELVVQDKKPILLLFSADHCSYCERLTEEQLLPLLKNPVTAKQVILREVNIDRHGQFEDFTGSSISHADFADQYGIEVTPTVLLLDHKGRILARKMVGYSSSDFYSAYLDANIESAQRKLVSLIP